MGKRKRSRVRLNNEYKFVELIPVPLVICDKLTATILHYNTSFKKEFKNVKRQMKLTQFFGLSEDKFWEELIKGLWIKISFNQLDYIVSGVDLDENLVLCIVMVENIDRVLLSPGGLFVPSSFQLLKSILKMSERLNLLIREEELIAVFAKLFNELFPRRSVAIRLVDSSTFELSSVYANGKLKEGEREKLIVTELVKRELEELPSWDKLKDKVIISEEYIPIFVDKMYGFVIPLVDQMDFYGLLNIEYEEQQQSSIAHDFKIIRNLSSYFTMAIRNLRLFHNSLYLKEYLEKILEHAYLPIIMTDMSWKIQIVNKMWENITGFKREDIKGKVIFDTLPEKTASRLKPAFYRALKGETIKNLEIIIESELDPTRNIRLSLTIVPIKTQFQEIEGVIIIGYDLTELRNLQKQMIQSEKLATIGQLAAGIVHELNNPLTFISVYTEYLLNKYKNSDLIDKKDINKLERIYEGAERILRLTRDLISYARTPSEEPTLVDVKELIESSVVFCEHIIKRAGATVMCNIEEKIPRLYGIKSQLQQVMVNLITNACHAVQPGHGKIKIEAYRYSDDKIRIDVIDNGCGIPQENLNKIFEPFFTTKPEGEGTGLGLSIVKNIISNHNGDIFVESEVGKGSKFSIVLEAE